jgi:hypothetical protein
MQTDLLAGKGPSKRREFFYWTDDGDLAGLRYDQWKIVFMEQQGARPGSLATAARSSTRAEDFQFADRPV